MIWKRQEKRTAFPSFDFQGKRQASHLLLGDPWYQSTVPPPHPVCSETDRGKAAQAVVWESARWWRWWQRYKRIRSNYLPGEEAVREQTSSWRKQNAGEQIDKPVCVGEGGVFDKPAGIFDPNCFKYPWYFFGGFLITSFLLSAGSFTPQKCA